MRTLRIVASVWLAWLIGFVAYTVLAGTHPRDAEDLAWLLGVSAFAAAFMTVLTFTVIKPDWDIEWPWTRWQQAAAYEKYRRSDAGRWGAAQEAALAAGEEIQPPWVVYPSCEVTGGPMSSAWRQGQSEWWIKSIWFPFWHRLSPEQRTTYLGRWEAPDEWRDYLEPGRPAPSDGERNSLAGYALNLWLMEPAPEPPTGEGETGGVPTG